MQRVVPVRQATGIHVQVEVDFRSHGAGAQIRNRFNQGSKASGRHGVKWCVRKHPLQTSVRSQAAVMVQAPLVVINTGTSSLVPEIPGLTGTPYLTNRNFFDLQELPPRLLVMGGGYGLELGQGLARLGSETQIICGVIASLVKKSPM